MKAKTKIPCTRCRMGVPIGITIAFIGLTGIILNVVNHEATGIFELFPYIALFIIGPPFARMASLVNRAHARIDNIQETS